MEPSKRATCRRATYCGAGGRTRRRRTAAGPSPPTGASTRRSCSRPIRARAPCSGWRGKARLDPSFPRRSWRTAWSISAAPTATSTRSSERALAKHFHPGDLGVVHVAVEITNYRSQREDRDHHTDAEDGHAGIGARMVGTKGFTSQALLAGFVHGCLLADGSHYARPAPGLAPEGAARTMLNLPQIQAAGGQEAGSSR